MERVVITGLGAITPIGNNVNQLWNSVVNSKSGIDKITSYNSENSQIKVAAEVKNYNSADYFNPMERKKIERFTQFALISSKEAYKDAGLDSCQLDHNRMAVVFGTGIGGVSSVGEEYYNLKTKDERYVSSMTIPANIVNMAAANISIKFGIKGGAFDITTACSTGTDCIGHAYRQIKYGFSDVVIAGASDACIDHVIIAGFNSIKALSKSDDPLRASIPFDLERGGFVIGEGAGALILEGLSHALKRNAKIYGEIVGYGITSDAYSILAPAPDLDAGIRAIESSLEDAGIGQEEISYINAHGTGTKLNDATESKILEKVFYDNGNKVPVSSTKSMTGHLLGAAGAIEAIICIKALNDNFIPQTVGYKVPDPECKLDYVVEGGRHAQLQYALSNTLGFGGHNSSLIIKKYE